MQAKDRTVAFLNAKSMAVRFLLLFGLVFAICYFLFGLAPGVRLGIIKPFTAVLAKGVAAIINLFWRERLVRGNNCALVTLFNEYSNGLRRR